MSSHKPAGTLVWRVTRRRHVQGNLAILLGKLADAFHRFYQLNPTPCLIIGISEAGNPGILCRLAVSATVRGEAPEYLGVGYQTAIARSVVNRSSECGDGSTRFRPNAFAR